MLWSKGNADPISQFARGWYAALSYKAEVLSRQFATVRFVFDKALAISAIATSPRAEPMHLSAGGVKQGLGWL